MNWSTRNLLGMERRQKRAAVLGCGPAGLFAAWGLEQAGWAVSIFSKKRKSHLYGAQYLHAPIPGLTPDEEPVTVKYSLTGTVDDYRQKVYGVREEQILTSVQAIEPEHPGWDLRATYDAAWDRYEKRITHIEISPEVLGVFKWEPGEIEPIMARNVIDIGAFDAIVSTVPLPDLCYQRGKHQFHAVNVWAYGDAPDRGQLSPIRPAENTVECNGDRDTGWYRASNIYGHVTVEWPLRRKPPLPGVAEVTKPIYTDCNCYREGSKLFVPLGRYGQWSKGVLTHHAYTQAVQL